MKRVIGFVIPLSIVSIGLIILAYSGLSLIGQRKCRDIRIAAGQEKGDSILFAEETKKLFEQYSNQEICITVVATDGTRENLKKLEKKEAELATAQADILVMNHLPDLKPVNGKKVDDLNSSVRPKSAQTVSLLFFDMYQLVVRDDSKITKVSDLKDKRVAMPPKIGGQIESFAFLMKHYNLITNNQPLFTLLEEGDEQEAFCHQEVDAVFYVRGVGNQSIRDLLTKCHGRLVDIDQAAAMVSNNPYLEETEIPQAAYQGGLNPIPAETVKTVGVPRLLLAHESVSKEVIKQIIQILEEHKDELVTAIPLAAKMSSPNNSDLKGRFGPIHPGRQAYDEREKPSWIEKNSGAIQIVVAILIAIIPVVWLWLQQREQKRRNKAEDYIREVTALMDAQDCLQALVEYLNNENSQEKAKFQDIIVEKASKILVKKQEAVLDYRKRLISHDSLNSFTRTLERVVGAIKNLPESEEIFDDILNKARKSLLKQWKKRLLNQLLSLISLNKPEVAIEQKFKADLDQNLTEAKRLTGTVQTLQSSQSVQFLQSARLEMQRDLDAIFRRSTTALEEERISQELFQSFMIVWQVAADDVDRGNHRSS